MAAQNQMRVEIGEIVFSITSEVPLHRIRQMDHVYRDFLSTGEPDVTLDLHFCGLPQIQFDGLDMVFDSGALWKLYNKGDQNVFSLRTSPTDAAPHAIAVFDARFSQGDISTEPTPSGIVPNPLEYPLSEVLMVCLLALERGVMVHACGINDNGRGYLFAGNSTHGKTTMARLWRDHAVVLNDDRIILRQKNGRIWMYGTPWHGDYDGVSPQGIPLDTLFFLRHAEANEAISLKPAEAAAMLLTRSFPPLWDATGMQYTLDFCAQVVSSVPCFDLGVVPDHEIIDFVRCVK